MSRDKERSWFSTGRFRGATKKTRNDPVLREGGNHPLAGERWERLLTANSNGNSGADPHHNQATSSPHTRCHRSGPGKVSDTPQLPQGKWRGSGEWVDWVEDRRGGGAIQAQRGTGFPWRISRWAWGRRTERRLINSEPGSGSCSSGVSS